MKVIQSTDRLFAVFCHLWRRSGTQKCFLSCDDGTMRSWWEAWGEEDLQCSTMRRMDGGGQLATGHYLQPLPLIINIIGNRSPAATTPSHSQLTISATTSSHSVYMPSWSLI